MHHYKRIDYLKAEIKYRNYSEIAYEVAIEEFPSVEIRWITFKDAIIADSWKSYLGESFRS